MAAQTNVTLEQIWASSDAMLEPILASKGYKLSTNPNYDRALAALLYYNGGFLKDQWVAHPNFTIVMSAAPSLEAGLEILKRPFVNKIIALYRSFSAAARAAIVAVKDRDEDYDGFLVETLAGDTAKDYALLADSNVSDVGNLGENLWRSLPILVADRIGTIKKLDVDLKDVPQGTTYKDMSKIAALRAWQGIIGLDARINATIEAIPNEGIGMKSFDPIEIVTKLLDVEGQLEEALPIARCFYLWSMWEILGTTPPVPERDKLFAKLEDFVEEHGCAAVFAEIPAVFTTGLSPVLGDIGKAGGKEALSALLGEYAARPPTRAEAMQRLLAL